MWECVLLQFSRFYLLYLLPTLQHCELHAVSITWCFNYSYILHTYIYIIYIHNSHYIVMRSPADYPSSNFQGGCSLGWFQYMEMNMSNLKMLIYIYIYLCMYVCICMYIYININFTVLILTYFNHSKFQVTYCILQTCSNYSEYSSCRLEPEIYIDHAGDARHIVVPCG